MSCILKDFIDVHCTWHIHWKLQFSPFQQKQCLIGAVWENALSSVKNINLYSETFQEKKNNHLIKIIRVLFKWPHRLFDIIF